LLHSFDEDCAEQGIDDRHEERGALWLQKHFGKRVAEPVRLHVPAKRYLCATEPDYWRSLSPTSHLSLRLQGGPFTPDEAKQFAASPFSADAITLRRWDETAKVPNLATPTLAHFLKHLEAALDH
ncbi:MAG: HD domain-containing protein, partial [Candidatus Acidiferrum sp.]